MHKLLSICDVYAAEYNILFNVSKSKYMLLFILFHKGLRQWTIAVLISLVTHSIENVRSYPPHQGHIIAPSLDASEDILQTRNCFIGQVNNIVCFSDKVFLSISRYF